ncbi:MAG: thiamine phosphate synthase [Flavobacteriales bacterium]
MLSAAGVYLISNDDPLPVLLGKLDAALATGAIALLQYRRKQTEATEREAEARQLLALCQRYAVPLIINDDVALAERLGCGVHLGQSDGSVIEARQRLGQAAIIGRTCHDSLDFARQAVADGASYVAFGAVYASKTKPNAHVVSLTTLRHAKQQLSLPICVIGGLTAENIQPCVDLGVDLYAVVSDVLSLPVDQVTIRLQAWQRALIQH